MHRGEHRELNMSERIAGSHPPSLRSGWLGSDPLGATPTDELLSESGWHGASSVRGRNIRARLEQTLAEKCARRRAPASFTGLDAVGEDVSSEWVIYFPWDHERRKFREEIIDSTRRRD
jgi:hypothetical protein